jgi:hypothetical protein
MQVVSDFTEHLPNVFCRRKVCIPAPKLRRQSHKNDAHRSIDRNTLSVEETLLQINFSDGRVVERHDLIPITFMPLTPFAAARVRANSRNRSTDKPTSAGFTAKVEPKG